MKVNYIKCEEKAIHKTQRNLKRIQTNGTEEEIAEAQEILDEVISNKDNASNWMHPNDIIEKLSQILNEQIKKLDDENVINQTKIFIQDAKESLKLNNQGQEDAIFFQ